MVLGEPCKAPVPTVAVSYSLNCKSKMALAGGVPFSVPVPVRGTTTWVLFPRDGDGDAFAALASERFSLALTPGRFFGVPRGLRIGLAAEPARCTAALDAFARALAAFTAGEPVQENA